jgi:hypothetical protein
MKKEKMNKLTRATERVKGDASSRKMAVQKCQTTLANYTACMKKVFEEERKELERQEAALVYRDDEEE